MTSEENGFKKSFVYKNLLNILRITGFVMLIGVNYYWGSPWWPFPDLIGFLLVAFSTMLVTMGFYLIKCPMCGTITTRTMKFCMSCGTRLGK